MDFQSDQNLWRWPHFESNVISTVDFCGIPESVEGRMIGDVLRWMIWLLLIGGIIWLVSVLLRSKRPDLHEKNTDNSIRANHIGKEIERDELVQQRRERE